LAAETIQDDTALAACIATAKSDPNGKAQKSRDKILTLIGKKCPSATMADAFLGGTGRCGIHTATAADFSDCVAEAVNCRSCWYLKLANGLASDCDDYDDGLGNASCPAPVVGDLFIVPSSAEPAETPGSPGVVVSNPELIEQFGGASFSLNNVWYTRWRMAGTTDAPDAILIAIAGFGGDANNFKIMAEDLIPKVLTDHGLLIELWGFHRRSNQLEDRAGSILADALGDPLVALDWYYGDDLGLALHPALVAGPNRRANFYNTSSDIPFLANFTAHVNSKDIDAVVEAAHAEVAGGNVFLGGHSAGTGFTARYAATDLDEGPGVEAGFSKLRGLVLFEGGGGSTAGPPLTPDSIDRIVAKADGGLFAAVRDNAPRCTDGTPCTIATEAIDCAGATPPKCTEPVAAYSAVFGLSPQVGAASEPGAIQGRADPDGGQVILQVDQGAGSAVDLVPELSLLGLLADSTVQGLLGTFLDDDGFVAGLSPAVATSVGGPGPVVGGLVTWQDITEGPLPPALTPDNGPPPVSLPATRWGVEQELVSLTRYGTTFLHADANASDWYYSSSGLSVTSAPGRCVATTCTVGNVGASCAANADCAQTINLDSSAVSATRPDIVNLTQAAAIDIPVICFGGSNGLTPVPGNYVAFGESLATCASPSCDGSTARVVDSAVPNPAFPTLGDVSGGFEVHISEGLAHNDITSSEDVPGNNVLGPLAEFIARNVQ
jgi:pimeloyl-ACP methyl ester carboxylesterase